MNQPFTMVHNPKKPLDDLVEGNYVIVDDQRLGASGILFRIVDVARSQHVILYRIRPAFGLFNADEKQGSLTVERSVLKTVDLVQIGIEYARFGNMIRDMAERSQGWSASAPDGQ